jgi:hypothetical protein
MTAQIDAVLPQWLDSHFSIRVTRTQILSQASSVSVLQDLFVFDNYRNGNRLDLYLQNCCAACSIEPYLR